MTTNTERAVMALLALRAGGYEPEGVDIEDDPDAAYMAVRALLTDLRHFCDRAGVNVVVVAAAAERVHLRQLNQHPVGTWTLRAPSP